MSRYQEALDELSKPLEDSSCGGCKCGESDCQDCKKALAVFTLQELVEKATPKKPKKHITPYNYIEFECPNCNTVTHTNFIRPYCGECGQALDWSEDDE